MKADVNFSRTALRMLTFIAGGSLSLLLWWLRAFDRRQRLDVGRHRGAILGAELRGVADHGRHWAADRVAVRCIAGFEQVGDVLLGVIAERLLGDVRNPALALRIGAARKALRRDDAAEDVAWAMALGAVAGTVDQIGTPVPRRRLRGIRHERLAVEE